MDVIDRSRDVALKLMRLALPLLDRAGETLAAARLQHAIDTALESPIPEAREPGLNLVGTGPLNADR